MESFRRGPVEDRDTVPTERHSFSRSIPCGKRATNRVDVDQWGCAGTVVGLWQRETILSLAWTDRANVLLRVGWVSWSGCAGWEQICSSAA